MIQGDADIDFDYTSSHTKKAPSQLDRYQSLDKQIQKEKLMLVKDIVRKIEESPDNTKMEFHLPSIVLASEANRSALIEMELANLTKEVEEKIPFYTEKKKGSSIKVDKEKIDEEELATDRHPTDRNAETPKPIEADIADVVKIESRPSSRRSIVLYVILGILIVALLIAAGAIAAGFIVKSKNKANSSTGELTGAIKNVTVNTEPILAPVTLTPE
jgi:hypothetical protein